MIKLISTIFFLTLGVSCGKDAGKNTNPSAAAGTGTGTGTAAAGSCTPACSGDTPICQNGSCFKQANQAYRHLFVTSRNVTPGTAFTAGGLTFNSVAGADSICQQEASNAKWAGKWAAIIADSTNSAYAHLTSRMNGDTKPIYLLDETTKVAPSLNKLANDPLFLSPRLNLTEYALLVSGVNGFKFIWTGAVGMTAVAKNNCKNWSSNLKTDQTSYGTTNADGSDWFNNSEITLSCDRTTHGLFCLEVDK